MKYVKMKYEIKQVRGRWWVRKYVQGVWLHIACYRDMEESAEALDTLKEIHNERM